MDRKQFLGSCAAGMCACAAGSLIPASSLSAAETPKEDWRLHFVKRRYAALLGILAKRMDEPTLSATLHDLGTACSSFSDDTTIKYRDNFEGFRKLVKDGTSGDDIVWDREKNVITMTSPERTECFCPFICVAEHTPPVACECSLGWQQHTWELLLQKKVRVELKESVLRGGKRCTFEIHPLA